MQVIEVLHFTRHPEVLSVGLQLHCMVVIADCTFLLQVFDMLAAATYLAGALEPWIALIVFITIGSYLPLTIIVTEWRGSFRRAMNQTDNAKSAKVTGGCYLGLKRSMVGGRSCPLCVDHMQSC